MPKLLNKRGTRDQLNAAATASELNAGEVYLITDENRLAVGLSATTYEAAVKKSEFDTALSDISTALDAILGV
jgi:hypothetical protein